MKVNKALATLYKEMHTIKHFPAVAVVQESHFKTTVKKLNFGTIDQSAASIYLFSESKAGVSFW